MNNKKGWDLLIKSIERQDPSYSGKPKEKKSRSGLEYKKPEKLVEKDCLLWAKNNQIFLHIVEAKAVFSQAVGRYLSGQVESGFPDLVGNNNNGQVLWVELKAKDRRSTITPLQYLFLKTKIEQGCFAVVVDSADRLHEYYYTWLNGKNQQGYLTGLLPIPSRIRDETFDPSLGF